MEMYRSHPLHAEFIESPTLIKIWSDKFGTDIIKHGNRLYGVTLPNGDIAVRDTHYILKDRDGNYSIMECARFESQFYKVVVK